MPVERSAGMILFRNTSRGREYLVIRSSRSESEIAKGKILKEFWDFPKGRLEVGESGKDAALREVKEEVGIGNLTLVEGFKETVQYFTRREGRPIPKYVVMFLAKARADEIKLSWEHDRYEWLPYEEALQRVSLRPMKEALKKAHDYFISKERV